MKKILLSVLLVVSVIFANAQLASPIQWSFTSKKIADKNNLNELSIGMSNDYLIAIKYGSTYIRIGSRIFGDRKKSQ